MDLITAADFERRVKVIRENLKDNPCGGHMKDLQARREYLEIVNEVLISMGYQAGVDEYNKIQRELDDE